MKLLSAWKTAWLLPIVLTGCVHSNNQTKTKPLAPSLPPAGIIKTEPVDLPTSATTIPQQPTETATTPAPVPTPKPTPRRKAPPKQTAPPNPTPEVAEAPPPPPPPAAVSAIGELSSGDPANYRRETEDTILSIEKGLNGLNRTLDDPEQKTADHIREFLKQARQALGTGDVDGAHNLAAKAKVLLEELTSK